LIARKQRHKLKAQIREEELREVEYRESLETGPTVHFCEPEKGVMFGEEDEVQSIDLMKSLEISFQHKEKMLEASKETEESHVFKTNDLCMFAGLTGHGDRKPLEVVLKEELPHEGIRERQIHKFFHVRGRDNIVS
jgi:hypothetical protein